MSPLSTFGWGFAGSVAVEVVTLLSFYYAHPVRLPLRYRKPGFWIARLMLALLGGALAVGYGIEQGILAFNIGAATPLIITSLARGLRPPGSLPRSIKDAPSDRWPTASRVEPDSPAKPRSSTGSSGS
jgi:hypothetical protein